MLSCQGEGEPPVSISWQQDGLALFDSSAILMLDGSLHVAPWLSTGASYPRPTSTNHCVAQSRYGRPVSQWARVQLASDQIAS